MTRDKLFCYVRDMTRLLIPRRATLEQPAIQRLSSILDNAGQVIFGLVVVGPFLSKDQINIFSIILGTITVTMLWLTSILAVRR